MTTEGVAGLVLAAGESTRMGGFPKPLLHADGQRFVERILGTLSAAGVEDRVVVVGHEADAVRERADLSGARVVHNGDYESGMLSSVQAGVRAIAGADREALLLWPVDFPFPPASVVRELVAVFREERPDVVVPAVDGDRGHPALFAASTFEGLLSAPPDEGARAVVYAEDTDVRELATDDERILVDVDTPEEYWTGVKRYGQSGPGE